MYTAAVFLLIVPVLIGCLLGATRAGVALYFPWGIGLLFWTLSSIGVWAFLFAGSALAAATMRRWRPPLWLVLIAGAVLGSIPGRYFVFGVAGALRDYMFSGRVPQAAPGFELSIGFVAYFLQGWAGAYLVWVVAGVLFDRWLKSQDEPAASSATVNEPLADSLAAPPQPAFAPVDAVTADASAALLDRLPLHIGRDVVALEAEDHYVRVHTAIGNALLFARFGDAMEALSALDGVRVHRSYWVRISAVADVRLQGKGLLLTMSNGMRVPVSHGFREVARDAGISPPASRSTAVPGRMMPTKAI